MSHLIADNEFKAKSIRPASAAQKDHHHTILYSSLTRILLFDKTEIVALQTFSLSTVGWGRTESSKFGSNVIHIFSGPKRKMDPLNLGSG